MKNYNQRDINKIDEIDPCIAAEIKMKNSVFSDQNKRIAVVVAIFIALLTIVALALVIFLSRPPEKTMPVAAPSSSSIPGGHQHGGGSGILADDYENVPVGVAGVQHPRNQQQQPAVVQHHVPIIRPTDFVKKNAGGNGMLGVTEIPRPVVENNYEDSDPPEQTPEFRDNDELTVFHDDNQVASSYEDGSEENDEQQRPELPIPPRRLIPQPTVYFTPPTTPFFVPVETRPRPTLPPKPTLPPPENVEQVTYATVSDRIPDILPSFSDINDEKFNLVQTDDVFETCDKYKSHGHKQSGVYEMKVGGRSFKALCLMNTDSTWMALQRRSNDTLSFNRTLDEYATGFGNPTYDHWLGLENVYAYVHAGYKLQLRIELRGDMCADPAKCSGYGSNGFWWGDWDFSIGPKSENYKLTLSKVLRGNLTDRTQDDFYLLNNGQPFTTVDVDNDERTDINCADFRDVGAWWHKDCTFVGLNGRYGNTESKPRSMFWFYRPLPPSSKTYYIKPAKSLIKFRIKP